MDRRTFALRVVCSCILGVSVILTASGSGGRMSNGKISASIKGASISDWSNSKFGAGSLVYQFVIFAAEIAFTVFFGLSAALAMINKHGTKSTQMMVHIVVAALLIAAASTEAWYGTGWDYVSLLEKNGVDITLTFVSWFVASAFMFIAAVCSIVDAVVTFKTS